MPIKKNTPTKKKKAKKKAVKGGMPSNVANKVFAGRGGMMSGKKKVYGYGGMAKGKKKK